jgi:hypothetical protein
MGPTGCSRASSRPHWRFQYDLRETSCNGPSADGIEKAEGTASMGSGFGEND